MAKVKRLKLTWQKGLNLWCKVYRGKKYYLGKGKSKSDMESYRLAVVEWEKKRLTLAAEKPNGGAYKIAIEMRERMIRFAEKEGLVDFADQVNSKGFTGSIFYGGKKPIPLAEWHDRLTKEVKLLRSNLDRVNPPDLSQLGLSFDPLNGCTATEKQYWTSRIEALKTHERWVGTIDHSKTIGANVDIYIANMVDKAHAGQISKSHASKLKEALTIFKAYAGEMSVETFNGRELEGFHSQVIERVKNGWSQAYASVIMTYVKMFIRWAWRNEIIANLPRNLREMSISIDAARPKTMRIEEVKFLLAGAKGRTRLFLLLMLNTGANQVDIADLKPSEVDWEEGRIIRKRTKTKKKKNVPIVNYKLWNETHKLLNEFGLKEGERVFLNGNGNPLVQIEMEEDGSPKRIDNVRSAYFRLCKRLKIKPPKPLKLLRATSATLLYNKPEYRDFYDILLDHAPRGVGAKHYADAEDTILDAAIDWLGIQYGIS